MVSFHKRYVLILLTLLLACRSSPFSPQQTQSSLVLPGSFGNTGLSNTGKDSLQIIFPEELNVLVDSALQQNPDMKMALQRMEIARAGVKAAKADQLPTINSQIAGGVRRFGLYTMDGAGNIVTEITPGQMIPIDLPDYYIGVQAFWEIDLWGRFKNRKRAAQAEYLASQEGMKFLALSLKADVAIHYYRLLALDAELEIIRETISRQKTILEMVQTQKESGYSNALEIQQFTAQLLDWEVMELNLLQSITEEENAINFLLGRFPQSVVRQKKHLLSELEGVSILDIPAQYLQNRPDIKALELKLESQRFNVRAAQAALYPRFAITPGIGFQAFDPQYLFLTPASIAYNAIGNLITPLVNRNALKANFHTATANQLITLEEYHKAILNGFTEIVNELNRMENLKKAAVLRRTQSDKMNQAVETSRELYRAGRANYLEVLFAQQNALKASMDLVQINLSQHMSRVQLYRALGVNK